MGKYRDAASQLQRFTEARLDDPVALRHELASAGFKRSTFKDGPSGDECERFDFTTKENFPSVYFVNICGREVFADAAQQAL